MTDIFETVALRASGIGPESPLAATLALRGDILTMTQKAHDAALAPVDPGGLSHGERAALAYRMALLSGEAALSAYFSALLGQVDPQPATARLADPAFDGGGDGRLSAILRHTDLATANVKAVVADDIAALAMAGLSEDDIVRLSELVAFVSYQIRLTIGLRLMGAAAS